MSQNWIRTTGTRAMAESEEAQVRQLVEQYGLSPEQAREVLEKHGDDESKWDQTARSLIHFFKSPS